MKAAFFIFFLSLGISAFAQDTVSCRISEKYFIDACEPYKKDITLPVWMELSITVNNQSELETLKSWAEKNGYKTRPDEATDKKTPAISLGKTLDTFSCTIYYTVYSHIAYALDNMGIGCFLGWSIGIPGNKKVIENEK